MGKNKVKGKGAVVGGIHPKERKGERSSSFSSFVRSFKCLVSPACSWQKDTFPSFCWVPIYTIYISHTNTIFDDWVLLKIHILMIVCTRTTSWNMLQRGGKGGICNMMMMKGWINKTTITLVVDYCNQVLQDDEQVIQEPIAQHDRHSSGKRDICPWVK